MANLITCGMGASWNFIDTKNFCTKIPYLEFKFKKPKIIKFEVIPIKYKFKIKELE